MIQWISTNWKDILDIVAYVVFITSAIVKLTPTLKDDAMWLPIVKFLSKYLALNTPTPTERPK